MLKKWKKLSEEVMHKNPWWTYKHDTFERVDGKVGDYYYGVCNGNAIVVPILPDGKILMINNYRYIRNQESLEFPCGGKELGSTAEETARRELLEETGYIAEKLIPAGVFQGMNGVFENESHVFVAYVGEKAVQDQTLEPTEQAEIHIYTREEVQKLINEGKIWDGHSLCTWALALQFLP